MKIMREDLMHTSWISRSAMLGASALLAALAACSSEPVVDVDPVIPRPDPPSCGEAANTPVVGGGGTTTTTTVYVNPENPKYIENRQVDYGAAYRYASMALTGDVPSLADVKALAGAADKAAQYEQMIDKLVASPKFAAQVRTFWRNTFKTGQQGAVEGPNLDAAANFAASVVVGGKPYTDILTAATGTCATFNEATGTFAPGNCTNNAPTAGVLTDPGLMQQFDSNMSFRRVRLIQEVFACSKYPAERAATATKMGNGVYTSPWDFNSITGKVSNPAARVDFQDTKELVCANCHTSMNHRAPLFAFFGPNGAYMAGQMQSKVPIAGSPAVTMADYLPATEKTAWRSGKPAATLPELGKAMAEDDDVHRCAVTRVWNWAMSRGDVVDDLSPVPITVSTPLLEEFKANNFDTKKLIVKVFKSEDFTKF
jgi:hypothetical protein